MSSSDADMHGVQFLNFFYANYVHLYGIIKFFGVHWVGMGSGGENNMSATATVNVRLTSKNRKLITFAFLKRCGRTAGLF